MIGLTLLMSWTAARPAEPSTAPRDDFWVPDGPVHALLVTNGVLYLAGRFDYVSPTKGTGRAINVFSGVSAPDFPRTDGAISVAAPDGAGGWWVGGTFGSIGGVPIANLARIKSDRTVDTEWNPHPDGSVLAMTFGHGMLYVGGTFNHIGGEAHALLAALDPASGAPLAWKADVSATDLSPLVTALTLVEDRLYVGGSYQFINQQNRVHLGAVDAFSGSLLDWFPNDFDTQGQNRFDTIVVLGSTVYVGGTFTLIKHPVTGIHSRNYLAALDAESAEVLPWDPNANGPVSAMLASCDSILVGGEFTTVGGQPRNHAASVHPETGMVESWNPDANGPVRSLAAVGQTVYLGGSFTQVGGESRAYLASVDFVSGVLRPWSPNGDFDTSALALSGSSVFVGGRFSDGGVPRRNLAALDIHTGRPTPWNPGADGIVRALAATDDTVYLGGEFTEVGGATRNHLAAVDAVTGALASWNPNASGVVHALALANNTVYVGGDITLTNVGGRARNSLAAVHPRTGRATRWDPDVNDEVSALLIHDNTLYLGGRFQRVSGYPRRRLAAVTLSTGQVLPWNPNADDQVNDLALLDGTVLAAGYFNRINGHSRTNLAALDATSGHASPWNPNPHYDIVREYLLGAIQAPSSLNALALDDGALYLGGFFDHVGDEAHAFLAAVNTESSDAPLMWDPQLDAHVNDLTVAGGTVYAGGHFEKINGQFRPHLAVFARAGAPVITRQPVGQWIEVDSPVTLLVETTGAPSLHYQWQRDGMDLFGANRATLSIPSAQVADSGDYTVVVSNQLGLVNSRPATLTVLQPLVITTQPLSQRVNPGDTVTLSVTVEGHPAPTYQWRLNGENIPGAIQSSYTIPNAQPTDGGSYDVIVANVGGALLSQVAVVVVASPPLAFANDFASRGTLSGSSGVGSGTNEGATRDPGEPRHAGKVGGGSVWASWTAPADGIATFNTRGSTFDTLLAVYTGGGLDELTEVVSDEDRGGFLTSQAAFYALGGREYAVAIDGFYGARGEIVLSWSLDTTDAPFPRILNQPVSRSVPPGATAAFTVTATSPTPEAYQWFFGCLALEGETNATLVIENVTPDKVGEYRVFVMNATSTRIAESRTAVLEIGPAPDLFTRDKAEDIGTAPVGALSGLGGIGGGTSGFLSVALGSIDAQTLNNKGSGTGLAEPLHCGVPGGASRWFGLQPEADGTLVLDTIGSEIDTVLAVYRYTNTVDLNLFFAFPVPDGCDNDGAPDGIRSEVRFQGRGGVPYLVVVDGVNRQVGEIRLNWRAGLRPGSRSGPPRRVQPVPGQPLLLTLEEVTGVPPPTIQWFVNGNRIDGATNQALVLGEVRVEDAGTYSVMLSNHVDVVWETNAVIEIDPGLTLRNVERLEDGTVRFEVHGAEGQAFRVQAAEALGSEGNAEWAELETGQLGAEPHPVTDPAAANLQRRFYRVTPPE